MGFKLDRFLEKERIANDLICSICTEVLDDPAQTPCEPHFCTTCINRWLNAGNNTCPEDRQPLTSHQLRPASRLTKQWLNNLVIRCQNYSNGCCLMSKFEDMPRLLDHESNQCHTVVNRRIDDLERKHRREKDELQKQIADLEEEGSSSI